MPKRTNLERLPAVIQAIRRWIEHGSSAREVTAMDLYFDAENIMIAAGDVPEEWPLTYHNFTSILQANFQEIQRETGLQSTKTKIQWGDGTDGYRWTYWHKPAADQARDSRDPCATAL